MDLGLVVVFLMACLIGYEDKPHSSFSWREDRRHIMGLTVGWHKPHVASGDTDEGRHVAMASDGGRVPRGAVPYKENMDDKTMGFPCF